MNEKVMKTILYLLTLTGVAAYSSCSTNPANKETTTAADSAAQYPLRMQEQVLRKFKDTITKEELQPFVIKGYEIMDYVAGDINNDSLPDVLLVLHKPGENADPPNLRDYYMRRPLLLILGQRDGSLKPEKRNDNLALCFHCGGMFGDAYDGITIEGNGKFTVHHYGGSRYRWTRTHQFQYASKDRDWLLVKIDDKMEDMIDPSYLEEHAKTQKDFGRITFGNVDNYED